MRTDSRVKSDAFSGESWNEKVARQRPSSIQEALFEALKESFTDEMRKEYQHDSFGLNVLLYIW